MVRLLFQVGNTSDRRKLNPNETEDAMRQLRKPLAAASFAASLSLASPNIAFSQSVPASDGSVLPFPPKASSSIAGATLQESKLMPFPADNRLPKGAPNILIIMLDDVGFGLPDTFGGPVHTQTLSRLVNQGISYNTFHTTSICSP